MDGVLKAKEPLRGGSLLFTTKFPGVPGTHLHLIKLGWMAELNLKLPSGFEPGTSGLEILCILYIL